MSDNVENCDVNEVLGSEGVDINHILCCKIPDDEGGETW